MGHETWNAVNSLKHQVVWCYLHVKKLIKFFRIQRVMKEIKKKTEQNKTSKNQNKIKGAKTKGSRGRKQNKNKNKQQKTFQDASNSLLNCSRLGVVIPSSRH